MRALRRSRGVILGVNGSDGVFAGGEAVALQTREYEEDEGCSFRV